MAYSKRRYSRRPARRYRRYKKSVARKALYLARKANNTELKYHDKTVATPIVFTSNRYNDTALCEVAQGVGLKQRVGLRVEPTSININLIMKLADTGTTSHSVRVVLFQWKRESYSASTDGDYLETADILSYKKEETKYLSKTLYDRTYSLSPSGVRQIRLNIKRKLSGIMAWRDATGASINCNQVVMAVYTDSSTELPDPEVTYTSRLFFKDN